MKKNIVGIFVCILLIVSISCGISFGSDAAICLANQQTVTDDELTEWISGFNESVTISVILDSCYSRRFIDGHERTDGRGDLYNALNREGRRYDDTHIAVHTAATNEETFERFYIWNDTNDDGYANPDELEAELQKIIDPNNSSNLLWWYDKNGDGYWTPDELIDPNYVTIIAMGDVAKEQLEALAASGVCFGNNIIFTNADRNKDGVTTSKELFEYVISGLYEELNIDNDNDGLLNEDGYDNIDNDDDGLIDEDPWPPDACFWGNKGPTKPSSISGSTSGKVETSYTYSVSKTDPDEDDIY